MKTQGPAKKLLVDSLESMVKDTLKNAKNDLLVGYSERVARAEDDGEELDYTKMSYLEC